MYGSGRMTPYIIRALERAIDDYLDTYQGEMQGVNVLGILAEGPSDGWVSEKDGSDEGRFTTSLDYVVHTER